jgi:DivIVA domain-containing protein
MPTSDLDMPLLPSAEQIRRREFATVRRGYDPEQVRGYLTSIAEQVETLERELSQVRLEAESAAARTEGAPKQPTPVAQVSGDPYDTLSKRFASLIEIADREAASIIDNARTEAAGALDEARTEADRIKVDAQAHAEEVRQTGNDLLERARTESQRVLSGLAERRRGLIDQLEDMRSKLIGLADELAVPLEAAAKTDEVEAELEAAMSPAPAAAADPVDPAYEDLWVAKDGAVDIPDLAAFDLDLDDDR